MVVGVAEPVMLPPEEWPDAVSESYTPVKLLGRGGFASVLLARPKKRAEVSQLVAIKIVGGFKNDIGTLPMIASPPSTKSAKAIRQVVAYAHREFEILSELHHPNVVRLLNHWEDEAAGIVAMALSYAPGPSLHALLVHGGRVNFAFARVIAAQLVDAMAYLHSRAVLHRDVKPDNLIVTGADLAQDEIWNDSCHHRVAQQPPDGAEGPDWSSLLQKWHVTLIDFGFARALSPTDMKETSSAGANEGNNTTSAATITTTSAETTPEGSSSRSAGMSNFNRHLDKSTSGDSTASGRQRRLDRSVSRRFTRMMSAVGNRAYAAPEVQADVRVLSQSSSHHRSSSSWGDRSFRRFSLSRHKAFDVTRTLSDHVSLYGLNADAYSVGSTLLHMLTGVRPDQDANQAVALDNAPIVVLCRFLFSCCSGNTGSASPSSAPAARRVQYRRFGDIEPEAKRLIRGLMHPDPRERTTIRTARLYPYIDDVLAGSSQYPIHQSQAFRSIDYLQCVLQRHGQAESVGRPTIQDEGAI